MRLTVTVLELALSTPRKAFPLGRLQDPQGKETGHMRKKYGPRLRPCWCRGGDLNPYALAGTTPSR